MSPQYRLIKDMLKRCTGMDVGAFALAKLNSSYPAFAYRINHGALKVEEYHLLNLYTGLTFEMLWPNPYTKIPEKVTLNLKPLAHPLDFQRPNNSTAIPGKFAHPMEQDSDRDMLEIADRMTRRKAKVQSTETIEDITRIDFNPKEKAQEVKPGPDSDDPYGGKIPVDD